MFYRATLRYGGTSSAPSKRNKSAQRFATQQQKKQGRRIVSGKHLTTRYQVSNAVFGRAQLQSLQEEKERPSSTHVSWEVKQHVLCAARNTQLKKQEDTRW